MSIDTLVAQLRQMRIPGERRRAIRTYLDAHPGYSITEVLLLDLADQIEIMELIQGTIREGGRPKARPDLARSETWRLRTLDALPLGKVKMGIDPDWSGTTRDQRRLARIGKTPYLFREFGAQFDANAATSTLLLTQFGYQLARPRRTNRNAELREEKDASGMPVKSVDRWRLVEVGSVLEQQAASEGLLKPFTEGGDDGNARPRRR